MRTLILARDYRTACFIARHYEFRQHDWQFLFDCWNLLGTRRAHVIAGYGWRVSRTPHEARYIEYYLKYSEARVAYIYTDELGR
jgi:hypothetical protein